MKPIYPLQDIPGCKDLGVDGAVLNGCNLRDAFWKMFVPVCLFRTSICQHPQCNSLRWLYLSTPFNTCAQEGAPHSSISSPHPENFMLVMDWWRWCPIRVDDRASKREFWIGYLKPLTHVDIDLICSALDFRDVSCGSHRITSDHPSAVMSTILFSDLGANRTRVRP